MMDLPRVFPVLYYVQENIMLFIMKKIVTEWAPWPIQCISHNARLLWMCCPLHRRPTLREQETSGERAHRQNCKTKNPCLWKVSTSLRLLHCSQLIFIALHCVTLYCTELYDTALH